jgi:hypothetical protein
MRTDKSATSRDQYFHIATRSKLGGNGKERKEEIGAETSGTGKSFIDDFAFAVPPIDSTATPES